MNQNHTVGYTKWIFLSLALLSWVAVVLFARMISTDEAGRVSQLQMTQDSENEEILEARLHSIIKDTTTQRAQLAAILNVDVVSIVNMIEGVGKSAGVNVTISNAQPESASLPQVPGIEIKATGFVVEAHGTFDALSRVVRMLETLPIPSTIKRLELEFNATGDQKASYPWSMSAYLRILTT